MIPDLTVSYISLLYGLLSTGESNMGAPHLYSCQFRAMINDWREKFHHASHLQTSDLFPFGFVQASSIELSVLYIIYIYNICHTCRPATCCLSGSYRQVKLNK